MSIDRLVMSPRRRLRAQRGVGLFDSMAALALLAFGLLGLTRMQGRMVTHGVDVQTRATAVMLANQLVNYAIVDPVNRNCYTLPAAGTCPSVNARKWANDWQTAAMRALPGATSATAQLVQSGQRLQVVLTWKPHAERQSDTDDYSITVTTDVR